MKIIALHSTSTSTIALAACAVFLSACQTTIPPHKIERPEAERTALRRVPGGAVKSAELEKENGLWVWSFDIAQAGRRDLREIHVDANTGKIVAEETETPAHEAAEQAAEKRSSR